MLDLIITGLIVSICILAFIVSKAQEGYEDETGFHYGKPPKTPPGKSD